MNRQSKQAHLVQSVVFAADICHETKETTSSHLTFNKRLLRSVLSLFKSSFDMEEDKHLGSVVYVQNISSYCKAYA